MWPAAGRSALAASRSPRAPTTSPPSVPPGRRMYSRPWPTPPPCSTPSSREPALGLAGGRARSQGAGRRSRWPARRAGARRGDARLSGRHDRPTVRSGPYAHEARSGAAAARVSTGRRQSGLRRVGVEGATLATREVPPPRRSGDARCGPRLRGDHPRAAGVCGVGAQRPSRGGVSARPGRATPRVVSEMDVLLEVEGEPSEIEHAIEATGLARDRFLPESLPYFVAQFEARTGQAALLAR